MSFPAWNSICVRGTVSRNEEAWRETHPANDFALADFSRLVICKLPSQQLNLFLKAKADWDSLPLRTGITIFESSQTFVSFDSNSAIILVQSENLSNFLAESLPLIGILNSLLDNMNECNLSYVPRDWESPLSGDMLAPINFLSTTL